MNREIVTIKREDFANIEDDIKDDVLTKLKQDIEKIRSDKNILWVLESEYRCDNTFNPAISESIGEHPSFVNGFDCAFMRLAKIEDLGEIVSQLRYDNGNNISFNRVTTSSTIQEMIRNNPNNKNVWGTIAGILEEARESKGRKSEVNNQKQTAGNSYLCLMRGERDGQGYAQGHEIIDVLSQDLSSTIQDNNQYRIFQIIVDEAINDERSDNLFSVPAGHYIGNGYIAYSRKHHSQFKEELCSNLVKMFSLPDIKEEQKQWTLSALKRFSRKNIGNKIAQSNGMPNLDVMIQKLYDTQVDLTDFNSDNSFSSDSITVLSKHQEHMDKVERESRQNELLAKERQSRTERWVDQSSSSYSEVNAPSYVASIEDLSVRSSSSDSDSIKWTDRFSQGNKEEKKSQFTNDKSNLTDPNYWYINDDIDNLLNHSLKPNNTYVAPSVSLGAGERQEMLNHYMFKVVAAVYRGENAVIAINNGHGHWVGIMGKQQGVNNNIYTYVDPLGEKIDPVLEVAIKDIDQNARIDPMFNKEGKQQYNSTACGPFIVDDLIKLAQGKTIELYRGKETSGVMETRLRAEHALILRQGRGTAKSF